MIDVLSNLLNSVLSVCGIFGVFLFVCFFRVFFGFFIVFEWLAGWLFSWLCGVFLFGVFWSWTNSRTTLLITDFPYPSLFLLDFNL